MRRLIALSALAVFALTGCDDTGPTAQERESSSKLQGYQEQVANEPAASMNGYSPTRATINHWIETWREPGKLAYVYMQNASGELIGYYVLEGLPVSYCAGLTPSYEWVDIPGDGSKIKTQVPAPSVDGVYYGGGGSCDTYYGKDATTGAYIEYTAGLGINILLYDQPLPNRQNVEPLGPTTIEAAQKK